ncbi:MAG: CAP domain-containing protein [Neisseriaceae bacterium]|nr:CAP domain-containing protein [Neisseriaceae bacterium]
MKITPFLSTITLISLLSACSSLGVGVGIGTGFGGHGGIGVSLGGNIPLDKSPKVSSNQSVNIPETRLQQELNIELNELNQYRTQQGLKPLQRNESLDAYAATRAKELSQQFSHTRPNGKNALSYVRNFVETAENIAQNNAADGKAIIEQWKNSPEHAKNMANPVFRAVGLGVYADASGKIYWVQVFGEEHSFVRY